MDAFSRYARMPRPRPSPVDLSRLVDDTLSLYQNLKPGVEVTAEVDPSLSEVLLDGEQIRRALINLLDNTVEATEAPGRVTVAARRDNGHLEPPCGRHRIVTEHNGTIRVEDNVPRETVFTLELPGE